MALDDALEILGVNGLFPMGIYILTLYIGICTPWILLVDSFAGYVPNYHCYSSNLTLNDYYNKSNLKYYYPLDPENNADGFDQCRQFKYYNSSISETCDNYTFVPKEGEYVSSYATLWKLVCSKEILTRVSTTMFFVGNMIGCILFTSISDRYGRVKIFLYTLWIQGVLGVLLAFTDYLGGIATYMVIRCLLGAVSSGNYNVGFVYMSEMFAPKHRAVVGNVVNIVWSVATAVLPGVALLIPDWKYLILAISLPNFLTIPFYFFFPESLPWMIRNGRADEVVAYLTQMAAKRKMTLPPLVLDGGGETKGEGKGEEENVRLLGLMKHPIVIRCIALGMGLFFVNSLVYYGLTMSSTTLSADRYLNFFLSGVAEIPGYTIGMFLTRSFGRRRPMMGLFAIGGAALIIVAILNAVQNSPDPYVTMALIFVGKFGISGTYGIVFLFVTEIFPTNTRTVALGLCNVGARLASFWSPYAGVVAKKSPAALQFTFGFGALLGVVGTYFLPETHQRPLPNTIADMKELDANTRRLRNFKVATENDKVKLVDDDQLQNDFVEMETSLPTSPASPPPPSPLPGFAPPAPDWTASTTNSTEASHDPIYALPQKPIQKPESYV